MNSLIVSAVHRPDPYFSKMLAFFAENQCPVLVFNTGGEEWARINPAGVVVENANRHMNYYEALVAIKEILKTQYPRTECITLFHADALVSCPVSHQGLIQEFLNGGYDFVSCYSHPAFYKRQGHDFSSGSICLTKQGIRSEPLDQESFYYSAACPTVYPDPYYQGGYLTISYRGYLSIPDEEFGNGRFIVRYLFEHDAKFGAIEAQYKEAPYRMNVQNNRHVTQYGKNWLHIGDVTKLQYAAQGIDIGVFDVCDPYNSARLGYLLLEEKYGEALWPSQIRSGLMTLIDKAGGAGRVIDEFRKFAVGTCLSGW
jgi:hypothetical protein